MTSWRGIKRTFLFLLIGALAACSQQPSGQVPKQVKVGKPYIIEGKTYYPAYDPTYDKIGDASWYGPGFHGKYTASGEVFNQNDLTAAHPTLPMPSLVRVTNLNNGKSLIVRINDRGPFKSNRIIDLSKASAQRLDIRSTTPVRVQYLKKETEDYIASLQHSDAAIDMVKYNEDAENAKDASVIQSTEPGGQIAETTVVSTHVGQVVTPAAPIMSVSSDELATPAPEKRPAGKPATFVKEVWADDNVTMPTPPKAQEKPEKPETAKAKDTVSDKEDASEKMTPEKGEALPAALAPRAAGHYIIQAGSFSMEENAHKLGRQLDGIAKIAIDKIQAGGKVWWRVRLGPFSDKSAADSALGKVRATGLPDARIVRM